MEAMELRARLPIDVAETELGVVQRSLDRLLTALHYDRPLFEGILLAFARELHAPKERCEASAKKTDSLARKFCCRVLEQEVAGESDLDVRNVIQDAIRGRIPVATADVGTAIDLLGRPGEVRFSDGTQVVITDVYDGLSTLDDEKAHLPVIASKVKLPSGIITEIQIYPDGFLDWIEESHCLYRRYRVAKHRAFEFAADNNQSGFEIAMRAMNKALIGRLKLHDELRAEAGLERWLGYKSPDFRPETLYVDRPVKVDVGRRTAGTYPVAREHGI